MKRGCSYLFAFTPLVAVIIGNLLGSYWVWFNLIYSLGFLAILEWLTPENIDISPVKSTHADTILALAVPMQCFSLVSLLYGITNQNISGLYWIGAAISTGACSGAMAIVAAHEMIHRKSKYWQNAGKFLLFTVGNPYFRLDHLKVHHKKVGTSADHATAKMNESYYNFAFRSIKGQYAEALRIAIESSKRLNRKFYLINNEVFIASFLYLGCIFLIYYYSNTLAFALLVQGVFANLLLEYTNYIEHYGIVRNENTKVDATHSWETNKSISRFVLFELSRHADHHYKAAKPYQNLIPYENSPKLPSGYAGMFFIAMVPPLWRKIVNPILERSKF